MRRSPGALLLALLAFLPAPARAQELDGYVLPPGVVRFTGGGEYAAFDEVYGADGRVEIGSGLGQPLVPASFVPLRPLETSLTAFFGATTGGPFAMAPGSLTLGTPDLSIFLSRARVPLKLELGIMRRVQIGVSLPIVRGEGLVQRFGLAGGTVGGNPAQTANAALLARLGATGTALGAMSLLPTEESAAGQELQKRVRAVTGQSLSLPLADSVNADLLQSLLVSDFGVDSIHGSVGDWRPGDLEVEARVSLLDQVGVSPLPLDQEGAAFRLALVAAARFPTGARSDTVRLFPRDPEQGFPGAQIALAGDAFFGKRWWIGFSARELILASAGVARRIAPPDAPLSSDAPAEIVDWNPPDTLEIAVSPRFRMARIIAMGLDYRAGWVGDSSYDGDAAMLDTPGGMTHWLGVAFRFTSVPTFVAEEAKLPIEVTAGYGRSLSGPEGGSAQGSAYVRGSVLTSLWGRGLRR